MSKSPDAFRTISEVAEWLEIQAHVLRFWESKFTQVKPVKRAGGRRYYRPSDMLLLGGIQHLLHDKSLSVKEVQGIIREKGVQHVQSLSRPLEGEEPTEPPVSERDSVWDDRARTSPETVTAAQADPAPEQAAAQEVAHSDVQPDAHPALTEQTATEPAAPALAPEASPAPADGPAPSSPIVSGASSAPIAPAASAAMPQTTPTATAPGAAGSVNQVPGTPVEHVPAAQHTGDAQSAMGHAQNEAAPSAPAPEASPTQAIPPQEVTPQQPSTQPTSTTASALTEASQPVSETEISPTGSAPSITTPDKSVPDASAPLATGAAATARSSHGEAAQDLAPAAQEQTAPASTTSVSQTVSQSAEPVQTEAPVSASAAPPPVEAAVAPSHAPVQTTEQGAANVSPSSEVSAPPAEPTQEPAVEAPTAVSPTAPKNLASQIAMPMDMPPSKAPAPSDLPHRANQNVAKAPAAEDSGSTVQTSGQQDFFASGDPAELDEDVIEAETSEPVQSPDPTVQSADPSEASVDHPVPEPIIEPLADAAETVADTPANEAASTEHHDAQASEIAPLENGDTTNTDQSSEALSGPGNAEQIQDNLSDTTHSDVASQTAEAGSMEPDQAMLSPAAGQSSGNTAPGAASDNGISETAAHPDAKELSEADQPPITDTSQPDPVVSEKPGTGSPTHSAPSDEDTSSIEEPTVETKDSTAQEKLEATAVPDEIEDTVEDAAVADPIGSETVEMVEAAQPEFTEADIENTTLDGAEFESDAPTGNEMETSEAAVDQPLDTITNTAPDEEIVATQTAEPHVSDTEEAEPENAQLERAEPTETGAEPPEEAAEPISAAVGVEEGSVEVSAPAPTTGHDQTASDATETPLADPVLQEEPHNAEAAMVSSEPVLRATLTRLTGIVHLGPEDQAIVASVVGELKNRNGTRTSDRVSLNN